MSAIRLAPNKVKSDQLRTLTLFKMASHRITNLLPQGLEIIHWEASYNLIIRARLSRRKSPLSALRVSTINGANSIIRR